MTPPLSFGYSPSHLLYVSQLLNNSGSNFSISQGEIIGFLEWGSGVA